jgi:hypothetical protein
LSWDQELPSGWVKEFWNDVDELKHLERVNIPLSYFASGMRPKQGQLYTFCDASSDAYGAVSYLRTENGSEVKIALVGSKARVAPVERPTLARMELQGTTLSVKLVKSIVNAIVAEI